MKKRANGRSQPTIDDKDFFHDDKLFWSLSCMGFDHYRTFTMDPSFNFRVLEDYLSDANYAEKHRVSGQFQRTLSEMAVVDGIRNSIECSRDWGAQRLQEEPKERPNFRKDFIDKYQKSLSLPEVLKGTRLPSQLRVLCKDTPWPKGQMDTSWLQQAEKARGQLAQIWKSFRNGLKSQQLRKGFSQDFIDEDFAALSAMDKPEAQAAIEHDRQLILQRIAEKKRSKVQKLDTSV